MFPPAAPTPTFPYKILEKIGEGAMGSVYRAEDLELGRRVALKVIKADLLASLAPADGQVLVQRFLQEARAGAALVHPGAVTVHRIGTEGGWPFIAMEWLDGRTLESLLKERHRYGVEQVARLGLQVLGVLAAAHEAGVVHRDIKPANLMVTRGGRIKVTDFGIARLRGPTAAQTQAGMILGTPQYAAPEQLAGQPVDCRADLYALGGVLYEAIVGRPAFEAPTLYELIHQIQSKAPPSPSSLVAGLPTAIDAVILRALAKRPEERFAHAQEMSAALQPLLITQQPGVEVVRSRAGGEVLPTLVRVPSISVQGNTAAALVANTVRTWPAEPVPRQPTATLLDRLLERPLHVPAFCGAVEVPGASLLVCDGIIYAAFDPATGRADDAILDGLPEVVDATLRALPASGDPRVVTLLASVLAPAEPRLPRLDSAYTDLPRLAQKLAAEGFDGALRFTRGPSLGFALFSKGRRVLEVFGAGWPSAGRWEEWISGSGALASVEERRIAFPSVTFRQQLREFELEVVRPTATKTNAVLSDSRAEAGTLQLRPRDPATRALRRGDSTVQALMDQDPAYALARWALVDLGHQLEQYRRTSKWKALAGPLEAVRAVKLHQSIDGVAGAFDVATWGESGRLLHLFERVSVGGRQQVERFVARALAAKVRRRPDELGGAVLIAPKFTDDGLEAYLQALRSSGSALLGGLDAFTHKEGFIRLSVRTGLHVLLVEEAEGRRRPLMPA